MRISPRGRTGERHVGKSQRQASGFSVRPGSALSAAYSFGGFSVHKGAGKVDPESVGKGAECFIRLL